MPSRSTVDVGARFRQITGGSGVWVVAGFAADHAGNPHARLALETDRTRIITIAVAALQDRKMYQRLDVTSRMPDSTSGEYVGYAKLEPGEST
ncbi:MAG: hypothetical protein ACK4NA_07060 [Alphaproteobacteria bacterium]